MTESDAERLTRIETKIDQLLDMSGDHENRIRKLEEFKYIVLGAALVGGGAAGSLASAIFSR